MTPLDLISLVQAKEYLKVDFTDEDVLITSLIKASIEQVERRTEQRLYDRSEVINTRRYDETVYTYPINSVTSITDDGEVLALDTDYEVSGELFTIYTFYNDNAKVITLNVGYTSGTCPESLRRACLNLIEYWFNNRGASDLPSNIEEAISTFRRNPW